MAKEPEAAAAKSETAAAPAAGEAKAKASMMPLIIIGSAMIAVSAVVTILAVKFMMPEPVQIETNGTTQGDGKAASVITVDLKEMYVNVFETKGTRLLKLSPTIVVSDEGLQADITANLVMMRDRVAGVASKMTIDDLEGAVGRERLRKEIIATLNAAIRDKMKGAILDVYFNDFLIQ